MQLRWRSTPGFEMKLCYLENTDLGIAAGAGGWKSQLASAANFLLDLSLFALSPYFILKPGPVVLAHLKNRLYNATDAL